MTKLNRCISTLLAALCFLIMVLALAFTALSAALDNREDFVAFYDEYQVEQRIGISSEDAADALLALVYYMEGEREDIQLTVTEYGEQVEMYNRQEIDHMVDVKNLYQAFKMTQPLAVAAFIAVLIIAWRSAKKGHFKLPIFAYYLSLILFVVIGGGLALWAYFDFTSFWTEFHHLFFTNDLWLMDPAVCRMIRICPESLFSTLCGGVIMNAALSILALGIVAYVIRGLFKKLCK